MEQAISPATSERQRHQERQAMIRTGIYLVLGGLACMGAGVFVAANSAQVIAVLIPSAMSIAGGLACIITTLRSGTSQRRNHPARRSKRGRRRR